ncbi:hypothetical protein ROHU_013499 [Labeo rohita]|uniref:Uncharacterized protein n=1 Tax=Labeo rohita TaxID=84645 RepID=A0A498L540_LABRO|nr:hypothetical protein ROHU_013499 [Labeo rohita]
MFPEQVQFVVTYSDDVYVLPKACVLPWASSHWYSQLITEVKENVADLESVIQCELTHYRLFSGMRPQQTWRHTLVYCEKLSAV